MVLIIFMHVRSIETSVWHEYLKFKFLISPVRKDLYYNLADTRELWPLFFFKNFSKQFLFTIKSKLKVAKFLPLMHWISGLGYFHRLLELLKVN